MTDTHTELKKRTSARSACIGCHIAKRACDEQRPCKRCQTKQITCQAFSPALLEQHLSLFSSAHQPPSSPLTPTQPLSPPISSLAPFSSDLDFSCGIENQDFVENPFTYTTTVPLFPLPSSPVDVSFPSNDPPTKNYSSSSTLTPFSVWDIHTHCLKACNTAFQQMVGYTLEELQSNFFYSNLFSSSYLEDLNLLWEFLAVSYERLELKLCLRRKEGYDFCANTVMLVTPDHSSVVVEHDPVSLCDDKWKIGDFTHFPTLQVPPCDCRNLATVHNIREFWNWMGASEKKWC